MKDTKYREIIDEAEEDDVDDDEVFSKINNPSDESKDLVEIFENLKI